MLVDAKAIHCLATHCRSVEGAGVDEQDNEIHRAQTIATFGSKINLFLWRAIKNILLQIAVELAPLLFSG